MDIFSPSIILVIFPYIFIGSFPIAGLIWVTKWVMEDLRRVKNAEKVGLSKKLRSKYR
jgi:hypothetical protein